VKHVVLVAVVALVVALGAPAHAPLARAAEPSAVRPWIELELEAIAAHSANPSRASRALARVSRAMYLAALSGRRGRDDAVAGAASTVLLHLYPDAAGRVNALTDRLADVAGAAFARGRWVGRLLIARAESDRSTRVWTGTPPTGLGYWVPTPPAFVYPPLEPLAGTWLTWNIRVGSQFRPGPPPAYGSARFLSEVEEVSRSGRA
jgi:GNAT superfamily N-acetyltransferase